MSQIFTDESFDSPVRVALNPMRIGCAGMGYLACFLIRSVHAHSHAVRGSMPSSISDKEQSCAKAVHELRSALLLLANEYQQSGDLRAALVTRFRAYALQPGNSSVLHSIAPVYDALGDPDSALLCRRGVIPECAEAEFFNAKALNIKRVAARYASSNRHHEIHGPEKMALPVPVSNVDSKLRPEFRARHTESRGNFVSVLGGGAVWFDGFNTIVRDSRRRILKEHVKGNCTVVADVCRMRPEKALQGTVCFLEARSSSIYYHWMIDVLPKLALVKAAGIDLDSIDHFVVRCESGFQHETLQHLGVPLERVIPPANDQMMCADTLIVPFLKHDRGDRIYNGLGLGMASWVPAWLSQAFVPAAAQTSKGSRLYISRSKSGTRTTTGEEELVNELQKRGFTSVTLEHLSVVQQAQLMATATMVVAPHGAGLTNLAFCKPGTMVIEMFGEYVVPCYWALSTLARLDYHYYLAPEAARQQAIGPASEKAADTNAVLDGTAVGRTGNGDARALDLASRRKLGIDLNVDDFIEKLDLWMQTMPVMKSA